MDANERHRSREKASVALENESKLFAFICVHLCFPPFFNQALWA